MLRVICLACVVAMILMTGCGAGETDAAAPATAARRAAPDTTGTAQTPPGQDAAEKARAWRTQFQRGVGQMLHQRRFDEIETLWARLVAEQPRDGTGVLELYTFYGGLAKGSPRFESTVKREATYRRLLEEWTTAHPDSTAAKLTLVQALYDWAWTARGTGLVNTVTADGARSFETHLQEAWDVLEAMEGAAIADPSYYEFKIDVCKGLGRPEAQLYAIFEEGFVAARDYDLLYSTMAGALLPRWFGDPGEVEAWAEDVADRIGGVEGDACYARIAREVSRYSKSAFFEEHDFDWKRMSRGFDHIMERWPAALPNTYCKLAVAAGDRRAARSLFETLGGWTADKKRVWETEATYLAAQRWAHEKADASASRALLTAVTRNDAAQTSELLGKGADVDARNAGGFTPLMLCVLKGSPESLMVVLEHQPDLDAAAHNGVTALHLACSHGVTPLVEYMLSRGVAVAPVDSVGYTALHYAANGGFTEIVAMLLRHPGIDVNATDSKGDTPLTLAAQRDATDVVMLLIKAPGVSIDTPNRDDWTPLHQAAHYGYTDLARMLVKAGADVEARTPKGQTPLHLAATKNHYPVAASLVDGDLVDINARSADGWTALMKAVHYRAPKIVGLLLDHGADPNIAASSGWTPLHKAAQIGDAASAERLIEAGADVNTRTGRNRATPLSLALNGGHDAIVEMLRAAGASD